MPHRVLAALFALLLAAAAARAQEWPVAAPESQGMDPAALALLVGYGGNVGMDAITRINDRGERAAFTGHKLP